MRALFNVGKKVFKVLGIGAVVAGAAYVGTKLYFEDAWCDGLFAGEDKGFDLDDDFEDTSETEDELDFEDLFETEDEENKDNNNNDDDDIQMGEVDREALAKLFGVDDNDDDVDLEDYDDEFFGIPEGTLKKIKNKLNKK